MIGGASVDFKVAAWPVQTSSSLAVPDADDDISAGCSQFRSATAS